jgi:hypothetical protein
VAPHSHSSRRTPFSRAAGGEKRELLLTCELPVTSVSIVSEPYSETPDVIRLLIVEPLEQEASLTSEQDGAR